MATQFDAISAKLKAMSAVFLENSDYENLIQKKSVQEVCAYLKYNTGYSEILSELDEKQVHRNMLEFVIERKIKDEYMRLYRFVGLHDRKTLRFMLIRDEIEFMKHCLRYILSKEQGVEMDFDVWLTPFFKEHTTLNLDAIIKAKTIDDFAQACRGTIYYDVLKRVSAIEASLFSISMMLDGFFCKNLWDTMSRYISQSGIEPFREYLGTKIDLLNIMWIYRSKKYYPTDSQIIYTYLVPVHYKLSDELIHEMVGAGSADLVCEIVKNTKYAQLFAGVDTGSFAEENYNRLIYKTAKKIQRTAPMSMAAVFAYFALRDIEVSNITTIIEGIRYNFGAEAIEKLLVR